MVRVALQVPPINSPNDFQARRGYLFKIQAALHRWSAKKNCTARWIYLFRCFLYVSKLLIRDEAHVLTLVNEVILFMVGQVEASYWLLAAMFVFSFLQGAYRQCASCFSFYTLMLFNVLPSQTCDKCKIQFTSDDTIIQQMSNSSNSFSATLSPRGASDTSVNRA